jgi:hypothetical protein
VALFHQGAHLQGNHGQLQQATFGKDPPRGFRAVHIGHLHVHQRGVEVCRSGFQAGQGPAAIGASPDTGTAELGDLGALSLTELIVQSGIHDAIAKKLNAKGNLSKTAIAEGIINNVRKTIIREQLTDPKF